MRDKLELISSLIKYLWGHRVSKEWLYLYGVLNKQSKAKNYKQKNGIKQIYWKVKVEQLE